MGREEFEVRETEEAEEEKGIIHHPLVNIIMLIAFIAALLFVPGSLKWLALIFMAVLFLVIMMMRRRLPFTR